MPIRSYLILERFKFLSNCYQINIYSYTINPFISLLIISLIQKANHLLLRAINFNLEQIYQTAQLKMSQFQSTQQNPIQHQTHLNSELHQSVQNQSDNRVFLIDTSQDFQNIEMSQSLQAPSTFNDLNDAQSHQLKQQETAQEFTHQKPQLDQTEQVYPELNAQEKPEPPTQKGLVANPAVDYESLVSIKIFEKKINESLELKNQGNEFFKTNQYKQAIQKYSEGLRILDPQQFYGATQAECQKMAEVSASLLFNIGSCFFNINSWRQAEIYFTQTLMINPNHIKAIYKRALCRYELQNYDNAMADIKQAFSKDKSNVQIHKSYEKILAKYNEQQKKAQEQMKQISSKIFRKDSQKSIKLQTKQQQLAEEQKIEAKEEQQQQSGLWGLAPFLLVGAGAALLYGYKKWFSK